MSSFTDPIAEYTIDKVLPVIYTLYFSNDRTNDYILRAITALSICFSIYQISMIIYTQTIITSQIHQLQLASLVGSDFTADSIFWYLDLLSKLFHEFGLFYGKSAIS